jgi:phosphoserine phosphatase RsbU/P
MPSSKIKKYLIKKTDLGMNLWDLFQTLDPGLSFEDSEEGFSQVEGGLAVNSRYPIKINNQLAGWITGSKIAPQIAALISLISDQEFTNQSLAEEMLNRYRELNLLYRLSDKLAETPRMEVVAEIALEELSKFIRVNASILVLINENDKQFVPAAFYGSPCSFSPDSMAPGTTIARVLQTGNGELANHIPAAEFFCEMQDDFISLLCAPLRTEERVLGAVILVGAPSQEYTAGELKLLNTVALQITPVLEIARYHEMAIEKARLDGELQVARQFQRSLIPTRMPDLPGWEFGTTWQPAREVSGDFYDVLHHKNGSVGIVMADVSDKGMPASLGMVFARSVLRASIDRSRSLVESIRRTNRLICMETDNRIFVTLFYGSLNPHTGMLNYVNAGHNPPLLYTSKTDQLTRLTRTGMALGVEIMTGYEQHSIQLEAGDFIVLYTDGVTEATDKNYKEFGIQMLENHIHAQCTDTAKEIIGALDRAIKQFTQGAPVTDDVSLMVIKRY